MIQCFCFPIIGIANNGDFERLSKKVGIEPVDNAWTEEHYEDYFFNYVVQKYQYGEPQETGFFSTTEYITALSKVISPFNTPDVYDIRSMGLMVGIIYIVGVFLILKYITSYTWKISIPLSVVFVLLVSDRYIVQFFNSFFAEGFSIACLSVFVGSALLFFESKKTVNKICWLLLQATALVMFVGSKFQNILALFPLSLLLALEGVQIVRNKLIKKGLGKKAFIQVASGILICAVLIGTVGALLVKNMAGSNDLTSSNVILMDLLRYSKKPEDHLLAMGYSIEDIPYVLNLIGNNAFTISHETYEEYCQAYFTRKNEVKMILREPYLFFACIFEKDGMLYSEIVSQGNFTKESNMGALTQSKKFTLFSSFAFSRFPHSFLFFGGVLFLLMLLDCHFIYKNRFGIDNHYLTFLLAICNFLLFFTVIFGDSSHDNVKQLFIPNILFFGLCIAFLCRAIKQISDMKGKV